MKKVKVFFHRGFTIIEYITKDKTPLYETQFPRRRFSTFVDLDVFCRSTPRDL